VKIKELIEAAKAFPPEMDIAFWDVYGKEAGYSLDKVLNMEVHEYSNGYREVRASVEDDYS
jgi:L-alanine-DL-glutamate epimerase-like enolase superfamily enzyme